MATGTCRGSQRRIWTITQWNRPDRLEDRPILRQRGHEVVAASPNTGVNSITGEGLKEAMAGTQVVIDLANSPSFEDKAVLEFFETSPSRRSFWWS